jgi:hypothetical protein
MLDRRRIGKDFEGTIIGPVEVLSGNLRGGTQESPKSLSKDNKCYRRHSNREPPDYKSGTLPLGHHSRIIMFDLISLIISDYFSL